MAEQYRSQTETPTELREGAVNVGSTSPQVTQEEGERQMQLSEVTEGYEQHRDFDRRELALVEPLRTLRLLRHSAWLVDRWQDPAFPLAFPWLADAGYWDGHLRMLEQQRQVLEARPRWLA